MKVFVKGLNACGMRKTNVQQYRDFLVANGHELVSRPEDSESILLWTCAFRRDLRDNSISEVERIGERYAGRLVVAGCLPDIDPSLLAEKWDGPVINWRDDVRKMEEHYGPSSTPLSEVPRILSEDRLCEDVAKFKLENPTKDASFVDQFVKLFVAEGCLFKCTYCAERLAFPPYRSFPEETLVQQCRAQIAASGAAEVMLLGDSLGDYGHDIGTSLPSLIRNLLSIDPRLRVALQGLNPAHFVKFYDDLTALVREGRIRHMQLPIQSASERVLQLMQRPYSRSDIDRVFSFLNEVGFTEFDTHLIFGFPGETEEDFEETMRFVLRHHPKYVLASGFMESPEMAAYALPGKVPTEVKYRRIREAELRIKAAGIICNTDDSELSRDRCRTLNLS